MSIKELKLYNTLSREVEQFQSIEEGIAKIYCCGPTVYDYQHVGNFKTFIVENLLVKALRMAGYDVNFVMNITDVGHLASDADEGEDKIAKRARLEKLEPMEIVQHYSN